MIPRAGAGRIPAFRLLPVLLLAAVLGTAGLLAGCSEKMEEDPGRILQRAEEKALEVSGSSTSLRMRESLRMRIESPGGDLMQQVELAGAMQMPLKEQYEYLESWTGSLLAAERPALITMSYVTLDGGNTVYVRSSLLEQKLGVAGWVYYAPAEGENPYFDYLHTVQAFTGSAGEVILAGQEEVNGAACWRLEVIPSLDSQVQEQIESNPAYAEEYREPEEGRSIREVKTGIWVSREGYFPMRIYNMMILEDAEAGEEITVEMQVDFEGYGEELLLPVDAPAVYTKAD